MEASGAASSSETESAQSTSVLSELIANDAVSVNQIFDNIKIEQGDISGDIDESMVTVLPECTTNLLEGNQVSVNPVPHIIYRTVQKCQISNANTVTKQVAIAPRPVSVVKKITLSSIRPKSAISIGGTDISNRQMVVLPGGSNQLKLLKTGTGNQLVAVQSPSSGQVLQMRQTTNMSPLTKVAVVQDGESKSTTAPKTVSRFISLQQAQEMGLVPCGKINSLVVSPVKQNSNLSPTVRPSTIRHIVPSIKSPAKLLPAPSQGATNTGKVIVTSLPQNFVIKSSGNTKPGQVLKMESGNTILTNFPPGQKINPQQFHQLNVQGKGVQLVRIVPTSSATQQKLGSSPVRIAPTPNSRVLQTSSKLVSTKSPITKTVVIDIHGNVVQMSPTSNQTTVASFANLPKKVISKPVVNKSMSMTSTIQKICQPTTSSFTITTIPAQEKTPTSNKEDQEIKKNNIEMHVQKTEVIEEEIVENDDIGERLYLDGGHQLMKSPKSSTAADMKHVVLLSPHMISGIGDQNMNMDDDMNSKSLSYGSEMNQSPDMKNSESYMSPWPTLEFGMRPRKPCNCTKSQCLKLYCDCFANGEFCNQCNCNNCFNNLENEEYRQKAIRTCLERNPNAFRPKIGKARKYGLEVIRRHNKGCNCKRSGCLKNYCECYEGKIACSANCKCIGCRNIEDSFDKKSLRRAKSEVVMKRLGVDDLDDLKDNVSDSERNNHFIRNSSGTPQFKRPSTYMTNDVIDAVCVCLMAQAADAESVEGPNSAGAACHVLEEFARCLQDLISLTPIVTPSSMSDDTRRSP